MIINGMMWTHNGQSYECVEINPYVRRDGVEVGLATLGSYCADCGRPFQTKVSVHADKNIGLVRRCLSHRNPGRRVGPKRRNRANTAIAKRGE